MTTIFPNGLRLNTTHPTETVTETDLLQLVLAQKEHEKEQPTIPKMLGLMPDQLKHVKDLHKVRWGVIWYPQDDKVTQAEKLHRQSVLKLIDLRQTQMGYQIAPLKYESGWSAYQFLYENGGVTPGNMDTGSVPYYLLIVASPERIPWDFQQQLDGEYAVGRLWFDDPQDCEKYIQSLLDYEAGAAVKAKEVLVVGTSHAGDKNTRSTAQDLVMPIYEWLEADEEERSFQTSLLLGDLDEQEALRYKLLDRLKGKALPAPALLFTATHGLAEPTLNELCGALVMQDWPGEPHEIKLSHCLAGIDGLKGLGLSGMMAFCFACYSAGVPRYQDWVHPSTGTAQELAPVPYVSRLPQKLLASGLLGFIGHVSKGWGFSYLGSLHAKQQIGTFKAVLGELMDGMPAGHALDSLNLRSVFLSGVYGDMLEHPENYPNQTEIVYTWMARNDSRGHVLLGDPFVRVKG
jgi:hypothetical protein